ncbi:MAG: hypothetical protein KatS3mg102_1736 [Planctomycetota bacterium]|nr:MAG: hypothetical protein KatS3mg102_1736 [Planctomycetota bacterium]
MRDDPQPQSTTGTDGLAARASTDSPPPEQGGPAVPAHAGGAAEPAGAEEDRDGSDAVAHLAPPPLYSSDGEMEALRGGSSSAAATLPPLPAGSAARAPVEPAPAVGAEGELLFGELAVLQRFCTAPQIEEALRVQRRLRAEGRRHKIGKIAVKLGLLTATQAKYVLRLQRTRDPIAGYKLLERRGQGGMGVVYRAVQKSLRREVALKVLAPRYASHARFLKRFVREAKLAGSLNHPNIVSAIDVGESNGLYYYAMEYVDGWSVAEMIKEDGPFDEDEALAIVLQVAKALAHASSRHIVHRDVKPENILVTPNGVAKLTDLGLSKQLTSDCSLTTEGKTLGTPYYVSPELARGVTDVDVRSDIYSLGATLYHMLAGEPPFVGDNPATIMARHIAEEPIPIRRRAPGVSRPVAKLLERMMHKDPERRYQTAEELVRDIIAIRKGKNPFAAERRADSASGRLALPRARRLPLASPEERRLGGPPARVGRRGLLAAVLVAGTVAAALALALLQNRRPGAGEAARHTQSTAEQARAALPAPDEVRERWVGGRLAALQAGELAELLAQERFAEARQRLAELAREAQGTSHAAEVARLRSHVDAAAREAMRRAVELAEQALAAGKPEVAFDYLRDAVPTDDPGLELRRERLLAQVRQRLGIQ